MRFLHLGAGLFVAAVSACEAPLDGEMSREPDGGERAEENGSPPPAPPTDDAYPPLADVSDAPRGRWSWVPTAESLCGNGTSTGFGVRPGAAGSDLLIFLEDGGACWSEGTCPGLAYFVDTGFGATDLAWWVNRYDGRGIFDDQDPENPFANHHVVFVPYCTGDVHAGRLLENDYDVVHHGWDNMRAVLDRVASSPLLTDGDEAVLAGMSAGAYGAVLNATRVREVLAPRPVHVLVDSAAPMDTPFLQAELQDRWRERWNLDVSLPPTCPSCTYYLDVFTFILDAEPTMRVGLITATRDQVIRRFYGFGYDDAYLMPSDDFRAGLLDMQQRLMDRPGFGWFVMTGTEHTFVWQDLDVVRANDGRDLRSWLAGLTTGEGLSQSPPVTSPSAP